MWQHVLQYFSCPACFYADQGPHFEAAVVKQLCDLYGCKKSPMTYHTEGKSLTEQFNRTLLGMLGTLVEDKNRHAHAYVDIMLGGPLEAQYMVEDRMKKCLYYAYKRAGTGVRRPGCNGACGTQTTNSMDVSTDLTVVPLAGCRSTQYWTWGRIYGGRA